MWLTGFIGPRLRKSVSMYRIYTVIESTRSVHSNTDRKGTLKRISNIGHYITYDIMLHISSMHLKFSYFVLYTPTYRLTERKSQFHVQNYPCGAVGANIDYELGILVHGKVVVEFGRTVFPVDCLL